LQSYRFTVLHLQPALDDGLQFGGIAEFECCKDDDMMEPQNLWRAVDAAVVARGMHDCPLDLEVLQLSESQIPCLPFRPGRVLIRRLDPPVVLQVTEVVGPRRLPVRYPRGPAAVGDAGLGPVIPLADWYDVEPDDGDAPDCPGADLDTILDAANDVLDRWLPSDSEDSGDDGGRGGDGGFGDDFPLPPGEGGDDGAAPVLDGIAGPEPEGEADAPDGGGAGGGAPWRRWPIPGFGDSEFVLDDKNGPGRLSIAIHCKCPGHKLCRVNRVLRKRP
jgi:hypothetical protein